LLKCDQRIGFYANFDFQQAGRQYDKQRAIASWPRELHMAKSNRLHRSPFSPSVLPAANRLGAKCIHSSLAAQVLGLKSATVAALAKQFRELFYKRDQIQSIDI